MSPKTPGLGKPMAIKNKVESQPSVRFTDQPFSVQTPGQTITYATTKSIIASTDVETKDPEASDVDKENRLTVSGGDVLIVELAEEEKAAALIKAGDDETPRKSDENEHGHAQAASPIERGAEAPSAVETEPEKQASTQSPGPCSIHKSVELDIPQSTGRKTPVKKRMTPVQLASVGRRSSRRLSNRSRSVAQALDFTDEPTAARNNSLNRRSTRSRKSKSPAKMPQPFFIEEDSVYEAGVMQFEIPQARKKGKRSAMSLFFYKGKSFQADVALFEIEPQEMEMDDDWGDEDDNMDVEPVEPVEHVPAPEVIELSFRPSTRSRTARRESVVKTEEEKSVRVTRSRSKSEKSRESSVHSELRKGRKSRPSRKVNRKDLPARTTRSSSAKSSAPEVIVLDSSVKSSSKKRSGKVDDKKRLSDVPVVDLADDGYDGNFDADDFEDDLQLDDSADLVKNEAPQSAMNEETEIEEVVPVVEVPSRRATRSSLRSAGSSLRLGLLPVPGLLVLGLLHQLSLQLQRPLQYRQPLQYRRPARHASQERVRREGEALHIFLANFEICLSKTCRHLTKKKMTNITYAVANDSDFRRCNSGRMKRWSMKDVKARSCRRFLKWLLHFQLKRTATNLKALQLLGLLEGVFLGEQLILKPNRPIKLINRSKRRNKLLKEEQGESGQDRLSYISDVPLKSFSTLLLVCASLANSSVFPSSIVKRGARIERNMASERAGVYPNFGSVTVVRKNVFCL